MRYKRTLKSFLSAFSRRDSTNAEPSAFPCASRAPAQPFLGSILQNCFSFLVSLLYWRTPNWMPELQVWFHRCQIERNNLFPWPASCMCADVSTQFLSLLQGHVANSCSVFTQCQHLELFCTRFMTLHLLNSTTCLSFCFFCMCVCGEVTCESGMGTAPSEWQNSSWSKDPVSDQSRS